MAPTQLFPRTRISRGTVQAGDAITCRRTDHQGGGALSTLGVRLRPVVEDDLAMSRRFATEPGLVGLDWAGFRDAQAPARRFATDGYLGAEDSGIIVEVDGTAAGMMSWTARGSEVSRHWETGIALLPDWRGRGVG